MIIKETKFRNIDNLFVRSIISANLISTTLSGKNNYITLVFLIILMLFSNFGNAQPPVVQPKLPTITEPGRRAPKEVERQVEDITEQQKPKPAEDKETPLEIPIAPPGADERVIVGFKGIRLEGGSVYADEIFSEYYIEFVDKNITLAQIFKIARAIQDKYRNDGYLLTRVLVPEQKPTDGIIKLQIVEGYIESIRVEGDAGEFKERIEAYLENVKGSIPVNNREIERYLLLINDLPGISARAVVRPVKKKLGATELMVRTEIKRFDGFALVNNRGSRFRGPLRTMLVGTANSMLSLEEELKLVFLTTFEDDEQRYGSLSYKQPLGTEGLTFGLTASYGPSKPGDSLERFDIDSKSFYFASAINYPLIRSRRSNLSLEFGFEVINSDVDILGEKFSRDRLRVLHATGYYDIQDAWNGQSQVSFSVRQGLDALGASSEDSDKLSRFEGKSKFTSLQATVSRLQPIFSNTALFVAAKGQYAFDTLLSDEEFYLGGEQFGRGYDVSELTGEHGVAITAELQYTLTTPFEIIPSYQIYGVYDFGVVWNNDIGIDPRQSLASAGAGVRAMIFDHFRVGFEVVKPLTRVVAAEQNKDPRIFFHISGRY